ncbi:hypothetical protein EJB05_39460, partial [Eragrostis curvula]
MAGALPAGNGKIQVKFLVDKEKRKVVFAESGKEFVDVLLSFLTLPLGTIVRLLGKESSLGCFDELYKSVETLDASHFQTKACKHMLLHPRSAAGRLQEDPVVRTDETNHRNIWVCGQKECFSDMFYYSSVPDVPCWQCGKSMDLLWSWNWQKIGGGTQDDGAFVRGGMTYATTDNLQIVPANTDNLMYLLRDLEIENVTMLEEQTIELGLDEVKSLLKRSLLSDQPLTGVIFNQSDEHTGTIEPPFTDVKVNTDNDPNSNSNVSKVKLLVSEINQSVVHAEVDEEFCSTLFSFLTLPLGHVIKVLGESSSISCMDNLYKSVEHSLSDCIKSDQCRNMLLFPRLAPFFSSDYFLRCDEVLPIVSSVTCCSPCIRNCTPFVLKEMKCSHGKTKLLAVNPKFPTTTTEAGGGYAKGPGKFLVTNELGVVPFSLINSFRALKEKEHSVSNLVTKEFTFTEAEVLNLLKAALVSREALSLVCLPNKQKRRPHHPHY